MKICFVINKMEKEKSGTTVVILKKAHERGHHVYVMDVGGFIFNPRDGVQLRCKKIPRSVQGGTKEEFWDQVQVAKLKYETLNSRDLDILFLRNNPTEEPRGRRWAEHSGIAFARMIQKSGVLVLNDAFGVSNAFVDKLYFEELPPEIKPDSVITRKKEDLLEFWERHGKQMVLKPLEGSGGRDVYKIDEEKKNFNQIYETLLDQGYIIGQEFLPEVTDGDVRIILMDGEVLEENGEKAVIRRRSIDKTDFRSNLSLGGRPEREELTPEMKLIVEIVGPKMREDGLFFVGLDVVKDKLIEINVLSPGGIDHSEITGLPDFTESIIDALEQKVKIRNSSETKLTPLGEYNRM